MKAAGLEAVYLDHAAELLRFLRARGAGEAAEDLLQELWLKVSATSTGPIEDPLSYLYRAANNLMIDRIRSEASASQRARDWTDVTTGFSGASDAPAADRSLIAREQLAEVQRTLASLGDRTEQIFRRFRVDGVPQRRIAAEEGLSINTIEKHLQRAYRALVALRRQAEGGEDPADRGSHP